MRVHAMEVVEVDVEAVQQHPDNANNGDVDAIAESIEVNGLYSPIWVQRSTGYIVKGNHTYLAAYQLGMQQVPVIYLDIDDSRAKRIMVADNKTARMGYTDDGLLKALLDELYSTDPGLAGTGYDIGEYTDLGNGLEEKLTYSDEGDEEDKPDKTRVDMGLMVNPIMTVDREVEALEVMKVSGGMFTRRDYQKVRKALGLGPASDQDIAAYEIEDW
jgi:hypothetical protein